MKKKLLFTAYSLDIGGIESALVNLLNYIDYDKYEVCLVLEKMSGYLLKKVNKNVQISEFRVSNHKNIIFRKAINLIHQLSFFLKNYHIYDFSCCYATYSFSCNKLARLASKNNSIYVHSNYRQLYDENSFKDFFDKRNINKFKTIFFVSNESKRDFLEIYSALADRSVVINNFVDVKSIKEKSLEKITLKKKKCETLFVYVGRLDDTSKKLGRAINLIDKIDNTKLLIVGSGPDDIKYRNLVKQKSLLDRVIFVGRRTNPYPYMLQADYIILTSDYEGFPVTYLEAIVLEKRIITTIDVSDDKINMGKDYAEIVSKDEDIMVKEVKTILEKPRKIKKIDLALIQKERSKELEKYFDGGDIDA